MQTSEVMHSAETETNGRALLIKKLYQLARPIIEKDNAALRDSQTVLAEERGAFALDFLDVVEDTQSESHSRAVGDVVGEILEDGTNEQAGDTAIALYEGWVAMLDATLLQSGDTSFLLDDDLVCDGDKSDALYDIASNNFILAQSGLELFRALGESLFSQKNAIVLEEGICLTKTHDGILVERVRPV